MEENSEEERVLGLLRTKGLSIRSLDEASRAKIREYLVRTHVEQGVSLSDLAKLIGNKTSGYTSWLCRELGVKARPFGEARLKGIREKRRKYERRPFDGTDEDKAYLLGFRRGDLYCNLPWNGAVRASTSTTHPAMAELFDLLFGKFGHVYRFPRFKSDTKTFEWNLQVILDHSFDFLMWDSDKAWKWVSTSIGKTLAYLAGLIDAEGHIGISSNGKGVALIISCYNTDLNLLLWFKNALELLGLSPLGPYLDKRRGTKSGKYGIERKKDYWRVALARFEQSQALLRMLPLRHREKIQKKELAVGLILGEPWETVQVRVRTARTALLAERDEFVRQAQMAVEERAERIRVGGRSRPHYG